MNRFFFFCLAFLSFTPFCSQALPIGNPTEASLFKTGILFCGNDWNYCDPSLCWYDRFSLRVGYAGDFVHNRRLEAAKTDENIRQTQMWTNAGYIAINYCNRWDLFSTIGATHFLLNSTQKPFLASGSRLTRIKTETAASLSLGLRGTLWEVGCLGFGGELQYFHTAPKISSFQIVDEASLASGKRFNYSEWQGSLGVNYRIEVCPIAAVPYAAVSWSRAWVSLDDRLASEIFLPNLNSQRGFGYAVGLTLLGVGKFGLTLEKRFVSEDAFYIQAQVRL